VGNPRRYGIFFEHMNGNEANAELLEESVNPFGVNGAVYNVPGYANVAGSAGPSGPPSPMSPISIPGQVQWPYTATVELGVEHQLPSNIMLSVAFRRQQGHAPDPPIRRESVDRGARVGESLHCRKSSHYRGGLPSDMSNFNLDSTGLPISATISNGATISGQAVQNLFVACGYGRRITSGSTKAWERSHASKIPPTRATTPSRWRCAAAWVT